MPHEYAPAPKCQLLNHKLTLNDPSEAVRVTAGGQLVIRTGKGQQSRLHWPQPLSPLSHPQNLLHESLRHSLPLYAFGPNFTVIFKLRKGLDSLCK